MQDDKAHCSATAVVTVTHRVMSFQESPHLHMGNFLGLSYTHSTPPLYLSLSFTLSSNSSATLEERGRGVHIKAGMSKEQESQGLMSDCPADSTPVHKGVAWELQFS